MCDARYVKLSSYARWSIIVRERDTLTNSGVIAISSRVLSEPQGSESLTVSRYCDQITAHMTWKKEIFKAGAVGRNTDRCANTPA
jgi:hypothetical protein